MYAIGNAMERIFCNDTAPKTHIGMAAGFIAVGERLGHEKSDYLMQVIAHLPVIRLGLEPKTPTLKVLCSTN